MIETPGIRSKVLWKIKLFNNAQLDVTQHILQYI